MIGQGLIDLVGNVVRAVFLSLVGFIALGFIVKKEFVKLMEFGLLAVVVGVFIFAPATIVAIAKLVANLIGVS